MNSLPRQFKTNVAIGLSFATFAIFVYNKYDDLPSFTDFKNKMKTKVANSLFSNSLLNFSNATHPEDNTGKNNTLSPIKDDKNNENLEEAN